MAARAGPPFIVFTDHGDGTRPPDAPAYPSGVLCLDGVEISTAGGHYVALDMPASPYPLAGEARDVVEDVRRLGGFGIAAHPDSPKPELRWSDWTAPIDAVEWSTLTRAGVREQAGASAWRPRFSLCRAPPLSDQAERNACEPAAVREDTMSRWNAWPRAGSSEWPVSTRTRSSSSRCRSRRQPVLDPAPELRASFRDAVCAPPAGHPLCQATPRPMRALVMRAIRAGHPVYGHRRARLAALFEFSATNALGTARGGDELGVGGPVTLRVRSNAPPGFTTIVWRGGEVLSRDRHEQDSCRAGASRPCTASRSAGQPARRRVSMPTLPWILSNAIYVRAPDGAQRRRRALRRPSDATL